MKSLFEQMGGTYRAENGYHIPNLTLPDEEIAAVWETKNFSTAAILIFIVRPTGYNM